MRKTTTEYICEGCGKSHPKSGALRKLNLSEKRLTGQFVAEASTELCADCERTLHDAVRGFFTEEEWSKIAGIVRD